MFSSLAPELGALQAQIKEYRTRLKKVFPIRVQVSVVQVQVRYASSGPEYSEGIAKFFLREKKEWPNTGQP